MTPMHPTRRITAAVAIAALFGTLATRTSRAEDLPLPKLPEITPEELKELAKDPTCNCRKPTAEEQKVLDADPAGGLGKLGAITEDDLKAALDDLQATQKDLNDRFAEVMAEVQLGTAIEPKYHVHVTYRLMAPKTHPFNTVVLKGVPFSALEPYYRDRPPATVESGLMTIDELIKQMKIDKDKGRMKPEPTLQYLTEAELEALVAQTEKWAAADDEEMVLGARAYKQTVDGKTVYTLFVGKKVGIAYRFHEDLKRVQHWEPKLPGIGGLKIYEAAAMINNMGFGNVTTKQWYELANARVLEVYKTEKDGIRAVMIYEIMSALPLSGTLVQLEKVVNSAAGASWGKLGMNFFRDVGLVTIFIPGGTAFAVGLVADGIAVVFAFGIDEKDKWSQLAWTAGAAGLVVAARLGTVLRAVARLVKLGKMQVPKAYKAALAAYEKYLAALARWRELRKKPCLKVVKAPAPAKPPMPPAPPAPPVMPAAPPPSMVSVANVYDFTFGTGYVAPVSIIYVSPTTEVALTTADVALTTADVSTMRTADGAIYGSGDGSAYGSGDGSAYGSGDGSAYGSGDGSASGDGGGSATSTSTDAAFVWVVPLDAIDGCTCDLGWMASWFTTGVEAPAAHPSDDEGAIDVDAELGPETVSHVCGDGLCGEASCSLDCTGDDGTMIDGSDASWLGADTTGADTTGDGTTSDGTDTGAGDGSARVAIPSP